MNVIIVGASGYSGVELIRILLQHPKVKIRHLFVHSQEGETIDQIYPHLHHLLESPIEKLSDLTIEKIKELKEENEVVFLATPSGVSKQLGPQFLEAGFKIIDLSGDFRLKDPKQYEDWYHLEPAQPMLLQQAVYGLSEVFPNQIRSADYIANPGCYATSILLALAPLYKRKLPIQLVIIDAKSGVSGAGRGTSRNTHFSEVNENFKAYKVGTHQHIPEIEQILSDLSGQEVTVQMMTHLLPITRGILSTIYVDFVEAGVILDQAFHEELLQYYQEDYGDQPFIRVRPCGEYPETKQVVGSNYCDLGFFFDQRTKRLILISVIDNLMKGAAGQAVQNLNVMMDWEQDLGLRFVPMYP